MRGRVQGVFYRDSTREQALREGVSGWAANRADGTVEVVLEGTTEAVAAVTGFCRNGPRGARVDHVEASERAPEGLRGFEIR